MAKKFTGPTFLTYDSPSIVDPVDNLALGERVLGTYEEHDAKLQAIYILSETANPGKQRSIKLQEFIQS